MLSSCSQNLLGEEPALAPSPARIRRVEVFSTHFFFRNQNATHTIWPLELSVTVVVIRELAHNVADNNMFHFGWTNLSSGFQCEDRHVGGGHDGGCAPDDGRGV